MIPPDPDPACAAGSNTTRRWWLNPSLARLAFGRSTRGSHASDPQAPDASATSMAWRALLHGDMAELDLDDPAQRAFGDYELIEQIGRGGMGMVYRARQRNLGREVAIKLLPAGQRASEELIESLRREAQNAALLQHPNIVVVHELGEHGGQLYFAMQLVRGRSLAQWLDADGALPARTAAELLRTVAEAVDYAHRLGVLHLDLKPGNILVDEHVVPLIADFGLARRLEQALDLANERISGTPSYMAPEQAQVLGPALSPATDVWALGAVLYEMLTGQPPFDAGNPTATVQLLLHGTVRPPSRVRPVPADLEAICLHCLARDPAQRYTSARELAEDLGRYLDGRAVSVRPLNAAQRLARWARREPKLALTISLAILALVIGLVATTDQWQRAQANAALSSARLWESRREAALQLEQDGKGWEAMPRLLANVREEELAGRHDIALLERRRIGMLLGQGAVLVNSTAITDASPLAAELSEDASTLAIGFNDLTVRWYDANSLRERGRVSVADRPTSDGQARAPLLLRFVDHRRLLVTLDWLSNKAAPSDDDSWLVDLDNARIIDPPAAFASLASASYSPDGRYAVLHDARGHAQCWQLDPWRACSPVASGIVHDQPWKIGRDGHYVLTLATTPRQLLFRDLHDLDRTVETITPPGNTGIAAWQESRDGRWLGLGDFEGRVYVLDLQTKAIRQLPTPRSREITWLAFSEDDTWLAAVTWDGYAYAFDVASGNPLVAGQMQHEFVPQRVEVSRGQRLLVVSGGGQAYGPGSSNLALWRLSEPGARAAPASRIGLAPAEHREAGRYPVGFAAATGLLANAGVDGRVRLWRLPPSPQIPARAPTQLPEQLQFDGHHVVDVEWNRLRLVTLSGTGITPWLTLPQPPGVAELVDGGRTLIVTSGSQLRVYDAPSLRLRHAPLPLPASPQRVLVSADGARLATSYGASDATGFHERILVHDLHLGRRLAVAAVLPGPLRSLQFSADHTRLLVGGAPSTATWLYATDTLRRIGEYTSDEFQPVVGAAFARDQHDIWLVTLSNTSLGENSLLRWDPVADVVRETRGLGAVRPVSTIATEVGPFAAGIEAELIDPGGAHSKRPRRLALDDTEGGIALSADGRLLARAFRHHAQMLDLATGANVGPPLAADISAMDSIWRLAFSPDGRQLLGRTVHGYWLHWPIAADARLLRDIGAVPERAALRAGDPGAWPLPEARPSPPVARWLEGRPIPARAPGTSPLLLDLTQAYDFAPETVANTYFNVLPTLRPRPFGVQRIAGVDYDLRGMVQVGGPNPGTHLGIPVPAVPVAALHVLMTVSTPIPIADVRTVARVRLHYHDGSQAVLPIRTQREVPGYTAHDRPVPLAWAQTGGMPALGVDDLVIGAPRLTNPHPERLIRSLDLELGDTGAVNTSVCLGITLEPVISGAALRNHSMQGAMPKASSIAEAPSTRRQP
jgi:WD40 repeat protein